MTKEILLTEYSTKLIGIAESITPKDKDLACKKFKCDRITIYRYTTGKAKKVDFARSLYNFLIARIEERKQELQII